MAVLLPEFIQESAERTPDASALVHKDRVVSYAELHAEVRAVASGLRRLDLLPNERVAVYLPKQVETVLTMFGASAAGGVFVPVNPLLKPAQVGHILRDCNVRLLVTSPDRAAALSETLSECPDLRHLVIVGEGEPDDIPAGACAAGRLGGAAAP